MNIFTDDYADQASTAIALQSEISDVAAARDAALLKIDESIQHLEAAYLCTQEAEGFSRKAHQGHRSSSYPANANHTEPLFKHSFDAEKTKESYRCQLDAAIWTHLLERSGMKSLMDAQAKAEFRDNLSKEVIPATEENIRATFETLMAGADEIFLRGIANAFSCLDRRFKSHDGFKIGKVIILENAFSSLSGSFQHGSTRDAIIDIERIFAKVENVEPDPVGLMGALSEGRPGYGPKQSLVHSRYFKVRGWMNGNAHLWFERPDLVKKVNKLLAFYYGEVIPDAADDGVKPDDFKVSSTAVAADLSFYPTPPEVTLQILRRCNIFDDMRILEPSAGEGGMVRSILLDNPAVRIDAIEVHPQRAMMLKQIKGIGEVFNRNFLTMKPRPVYNLIIMNPPFFRTHWMKHVRHAFDFLCEGGALYAVLPISARVNESKEHIAFRKFVEKNSRGWGSPWSDLPALSFKSSGTNINTVVLELKKKN